ncbi:RNA pseudouridylate synthase domain-containing protein 1-like [Ostrinia nubilalis]|uniref:RNA pseudouridylate synthase domain-containing protein 1-like n=1 Tax=Ostrinia nubilalis TaxID=29057 RepID=UPI0030823C3E
MGVEKLYESDSFLVVNKPFDMYINSDDENEKNTVTQHIASPDSHLSTSANPLHFVQRLDYSTSGVMCIAKTKSAAGRAGRLFERRQTKKYYLAVVRGHLKYDVADIEFDVGVDPLTATSSHRMVAKTSSASNATETRAAHTRLLALETGHYERDPVTVVLLKPITASLVRRRPALDTRYYERNPVTVVLLKPITAPLATETRLLALETGYYERDPVTVVLLKPITVLLHTDRYCNLEHTRLLALETGHYERDPVTVVLLKPITGRRHQLRVHCAATGHTILGDYTYSDTLDTAPHRMFLHATRLVLPLEAEPLDIQTQEPFFADSQFSSKFKSEKVLRKYRTKADFNAACDIIDKTYERLF